MYTHKTRLQYAYLHFCLCVVTTRTAPIIQDIKNKTVVVGDTLRVKCQALVLVNTSPLFNLTKYVSNGETVPVKLGGRITMEQGGVIQNVCCSSVIPMSSTPFYTGKF